jgi:hypothetical protein
MRPFTSSAKAGFVELLTDQRGADRLAALFDQAAVGLMRKHRL